MPAAPRPPVAVTGHAHRPSHRPRCLGQTWHRGCAFRLPVRARSIACQADTSSHAAHEEGAQRSNAPLEQQGDDWDWLERSELLVGAEAISRLQDAHVLVVGLGGVGSWCAEMLVRSGVGRITLMDGDEVDSSNRNRQLVALSSTLGRSKAQVLGDRLQDISPAAHVTVRTEYLEPTAAAPLLADLRPTFVVDCIDSVAPKRELILAAVHARICVASSMGAGGKRDPAQVQIADISATRGDAFARVVRKSLARGGVRTGVPVVFSCEPVDARAMREVAATERFKRSYYGTMSYMPALFGMHLAAYVIDVLAGRRGAFKYPALPPKINTAGAPGGPSIFSAPGSTKAAKAAAAAQAAAAGERAANGASGKMAPQEAVRKPRQGARSRRREAALARAAASVAAQVAALADTIGVPEAGGVSDARDDADGAEAPAALGQEAALAHEQALRRQSESAASMSAEVLAEAVPGARARGAGPHLVATADPSVGTDSKQGTAAHAVSQLSLERATRNREVSVANVYPWGASSVAAGAGFDGSDI